MKQSSRKSSDTYCFQNNTHLCILSVPNAFMHMRHRDRERKQVLFLRSEHKRACVFVGLRVCIREAAADRQALGDYRTGQGTITHRADHWPQTDRLA